MPQKIFTREMYRKMIESSLLLKRLEDSDSEWIYDEFSFQSRGFQYYEWAKKNSKSNITCSFEQTSFSFVVALSSTRFYGIIEVNETINSKKFIYYWANLTREINNSNNQNVWKFIFIADNAAIHK